MNRARLLRATGVVGLMIIAAACQGVGDDVDVDVQAPGSQPQVPLGPLAEVEVVDTDASGVPNFVNGSLGAIDRQLAERAQHAEEIEAVQEALFPMLERVAPLFRANAAELVLRKARIDPQGDQHFRFRQYKHGLEVIGAELLLHVRDGAVFAANGTARDDLQAPVEPKIDEAAAAAVAESETDLLEDMQVESAPRLAYLYKPEQLDRLDLVYVVKVTGIRRDGTPVDDDVLVNAVDGSISLRSPNIHTAKNREVHNLNHGTGLPGPISRAEGAPASSDTDTNINYDWLGATYDCYFQLFGRDSYTNTGAKLISSVHYSNNYVNAFWNGTQMVYGDGDNVTASSLARSMDVTAHELTHAVTDVESDLIYSGQSGGLNEAMSDIFGGVCEYFRDGKVVSANTWIVGDDCWTPATPGDGLRYMNDPKKDGKSLDHFSQFTSGVDVHYSSGIANLAFFLLANGGTHPRGATNVQVTGIGIEKAAQIFYKANVDLMGASETFAQAKTHTEQAAQQLGMSAAEIQSVSNAWLAVGVGGGTPPGPGTCEHDKCATGGKLTAANCGAAVQQICAADPYCCSTAWDSICVGEVESVAKSLKCDASKGTCTHTLCTSGTKLVNGCKAPHVNNICAADPYCCNTSWDSICVGEVSSVAQMNCN